MSTLLGRRPSLAEKKYAVKTEHSGELSVFVQGDLSQQDTKALFLTVHDLGCNHTSFHDFVNHPAMNEIKERSVFIHIDVPGHEDNAPTLPETFQFPSLQQLGEDLVAVLDLLQVKYVIGLGEGAGANVLARFGLAHPSRLLGLILINCTGSAATVMDSFKNKFISWTGRKEVSQSTEHFLVYHKFGHQLMNEINPDKEKVIEEFQARLHDTINNKNMKQYVNAFLSRKDLSLKNATIDILLITGLLSPYSLVVEKLHREMNKDKGTLLKIERSGDVLVDSPQKVAHSILLFCKGQGLLSSVVMPGVERRLSRGMSMEDYDKPNIRRLSLTPSNS